MNFQIDIEEVHTTLVQVRQNALTRNKFPKELWDDIIHLTQIYPIETLCSKLGIKPTYLRKKIRQSQASPQIDFQEIPHPIQGIHSNVVIELSSNTGLTAKIQGPLSCLDCLYLLFGG